MVEDDATLRTLLQGVFDDYGFRAATAENGMEALTHLARHHVDVVVLDLHMPEMDGYTLVREMGRAGFDVPVFLLSSHANRPIARELGADGWLPKPFDIEALCRAVESTPLRNNGDRESRGRGRGGD